MTLKHLGFCVEHSCLKLCDLATWVCSFLGSSRKVSWRKGWLASSNHKEREDMGSSYLAQLTSCGKND